MNTIIIKHNSVPECVPLASELEDGEIALNTADGALFYKKPSGQVAALLAGADPIDGGTYADHIVPIPPSTGGGGGGQVNVSDVIGLPEYVLGMVVAGDPNCASKTVCGLIDGGNA